MVSSLLSRGVRPGICNLKAGGSGAADVPGEPLPASLVMKVTREPIEAASAQGPLMANGIVWEEGDDGMILGPSLGKGPPSFSALIGKF